MFLSFISTELLSYRAEKGIRFSKDMDSCQSLCSVPSDRAATSMGPAAVPFKIRKPGHLGSSVD